MDFKKELNYLVDFLKKTEKDKGGKITNAEIADRLGYTRTHLSALLGKGAKVERGHIDNFKAHFAKELTNAARPAPGDPNNTITAIVLAMLDDYTEKAAQQEGVEYDVVKQRLQQKARLILNNLNSWIDGVV